jgi:hypothetical protein
MIAHLHDLCNTITHSLPRTPDEHIGVWFVLAVPPALVTVCTMTVMRPLGFGEEPCHRCLGSSLHQALRLVGVGWLYGSRCRYHHELMGGVAPQAPLPWPRLAMANSPALAIAGPPSLALSTN